MKKKIIIAFLFLGFLLFGVIEWKSIINSLNKIYLSTKLNPIYLLTIIEQETGFAQNLGWNAGSKEKNLERCVNMCYREMKIKPVYCYDISKRRSWCEEQYYALKEIVGNLGLDVNKVPISPDFGIGYTQFQPTTWVQYPELKNKNPWNIEDALYATAIKLIKDGIHQNEERAIKKYNGSETYWDDYKEKKDEWNQILDDTIFVYCYSNNDYSCALIVLRDKFDDCTQASQDIKIIKSCIQTKVAEQKKSKIAYLESQRKFLLSYYQTQLTQLAYSTVPVIGYDKNLVSQIEFLKKASIEELNKQFSFSSFQPQFSENQQKENKPTITFKEEKKDIIYQEKDLTKEKIVLNTNLNQKQEKQKEQTKVIKNQEKENKITTTTLVILMQNISQSSNQQNLHQGGSYYSSTSENNNSQTNKDPCKDYQNRNYPNILINEIQFETATDTQDEFIELYNPTNEEIDLTCWSLVKYASKQSPTSTPTLTPLIPQSKFKGKIKPYGFFLITSSSTKEKYNGDLAYSESYSISKNNTILLKKPNETISDLIGYGDNQEKIYQFETQPFIFENFENKSIQRKNFQDTNNNLQDFWLHSPSPKNSNFAELPRQDFIDLTQIFIENFNVIATSTEDENFLLISFTEPLINVSSTNYAYDLLISTSTNFSSFFKLIDFSSTTTLPLPQFDSSTTTIQTQITQCPSTSTTYYFALYLKDNLDNENKSNYSISSTTIPFCNQEQEYQLIQNISTTTTSTGKVLFSEIYIREGTSTNEFIELYNPNEFNIDLTKWKIERIKSNGKSQTIIPSSKLKGIIPAFSYFLLVNANTSTETTTPDFIYSKSYDLAKNNALRLYDKDNNLIDEVCWGNPKGFSNCADNPTSTALSLNRKKTAKTTEENYFDEHYYNENDEKIYLGNAYDTNNSSNDFLYTILNPQNSAITLRTILDLENFQITLDPPPINTYAFEFPYCMFCPSYIDPSSGSYQLKFSWFNPIIYDKNNLQLEIRYTTTSSTSSELLISTSTIRFLDNQTVSLNIFEFYQQQNIIFPSSTIFYLTIKDEDNILKTTSTILTIHFSQYKGRLEIPKDKIDYLSFPGWNDSDGIIKFKARYSSQVQYIALVKTGWNIQDPFVYLYQVEGDNDNLIATSSITADGGFEGLSTSCSYQSFIVWKLENPFFIEKNKIYKIFSNNPSLRVKTSCSGEGNLFGGAVYLFGKIY